MKIAIFGTGYVGLTTGACLADLSHHVTCVDIDTTRIEGLNDGHVPFYEPGLEKLVKNNREAGRLMFTTDAAAAIRENDVIFIAVGTPTAADGSVDLSQVLTVAEMIGKNIDGYKVIVDKSTVPPGTGRQVYKIIAEANNGDFAVVSNPEFLKEGSAIKDFENSDRVVIGADSEKAAAIITAIYEKLDCPVLTTDIATAEIIKYASNAYLATSISFINMISEICERVGGDITKVAEGMRLDKRIGRHAFLDAGLGYGGSCFPKDVKGLTHISGENSMDAALLKSIEEINKRQRDRFIEKVREVVPEMKGAVMGMWGLAFKPGSDDIREAPAIDIARRLINEGAHIKAYDPVAASRAVGVLPEVEYCKAPFDAADGCDCLLIMTEWDDFHRVDLQALRKALKNPSVIDGRNIYDPIEMKELGFTYKCFGRSFEP